MGKFNAKKTQKKKFNITRKAPMHGGMMEAINQATGEVLNILDPISTSVSALVPFQATKVKTAPESSVYKSHSHHLLY